MQKPLKQRQSQRQWQAESSLLLMPKGYVDLPSTKIFKQHSQGNSGFFPRPLACLFHLLNFVNAGLHLLSCEEAYLFVGMGQIPIDLSSLPEWCVAWVISSSSWYPNPDRFVYDPS